MAQKPLSEMSYKGYENHSEEFGFIREEWVLDRISLQDKLDNCVSKEDWAEFVAYVSSAYLCKDDFVTSIIALSEKVDAAKAAIKALADKLDSEDVSNLDTDYRVAVDAVIK